MTYIFSDDMKKTIVHGGEAEAPRAPAASKPSQPKTKVVIGTINVYITPPTKDA